MNIVDLEKEAREELDGEKVTIAKSIIKQRITEIQKAEAVLLKLQKRYEELLAKSVDDVVEEIENGDIRF